MCRSLINVRAMTFCTLVAWCIAQAQAPPATILTIDVQNFVAYHDDISGAFTRVRTLASSPARATTVLGLEHILARSWSCTPTVGITSGNVLSVAGAR